MYKDKDEKASGYMLAKLFDELRIMTGVTIRKMAQTSKPAARIAVKLDIELHEVAR